MIDGELLAIKDSILKTKLAIENAQDFMNFVKI